MFYEGCLVVCRDLMHQAGLEKKAHRRLAAQTGAHRQDHPRSAKIARQVDDRWEVGRRCLPPRSFPLAGPHVAASTQTRYRDRAGGWRRANVAGAVLQVDFDLRVASFETLHEADNKFRAEWCGQTDLESLRVLVALCGTVQCLLETGIVIAHALDPFPPLICQPDAIVVALEDLDIELLLECTNVAGYGGLAAPSGAQAPRSHASQFCRRENIFEKAQRFVHLRNYRVSATTRSKALENPTREMEKMSSCPPSAVAMTWS